MADDDDRRFLRDGVTQIDRDFSAAFGSGRFWAAIGIIITIGIVFLAWSEIAKARDSGQWEETTPAVREWYRSLMQPDKPWVPCCGESDAYFADAKVRGGKTLAVIVDDRDDEPRRRHHVPVGTEIEVPPHKLKWNAGNPTGHAVIFLTVNNEVYCFVQGTGI